MDNAPRALVTGGAGFIGSNIVRFLVDNHWSVRVIDDLSTGFTTNIEGLVVDFLEGSICNPELVNQACKDVDVVFHLAAQVGRQKSLENPWLDSETNLIGTVTLLESIRSNGIKRLVYSSSAAIYGELEKTAISEDHPQNADSPYGVSKLAAEKMVLAYSKIYNIETVCLRYFNIYGLNQRFDLYGNVIPIFAECLYRGKPLTIYGNGNQTRDFINVRDVVKANYIAATNKVKMGAYNIGSGKWISIKNLAELMKQISKIDTAIEYAPKRPADVMHCCADISTAKRELGFEPTVNLDDGLREYLNWYKFNL